MSPTNHYVKSDCNIPPTSLEDELRTINQLYASHPDGIVPFNIPCISERVYDIKPIGSVMTREVCKHEIVKLFYKNLLMRFFYKNFYKVEITHTNFPYKLPRWRAHRFLG